MDAYLPPLDQPKGLYRKLAFFFIRRQFGKVIMSIRVFATRMPTAFMNYYYKMSALDKKLQVPSQTSVLIREQVASINQCLFCMDASRWYVMTREPGDLARLEHTIPFVRDGAKTTLELADATLFALKRRPLALPDKAREMLTEEARARLARLREAYAAADAWTVPELEALNRAFAEREGVER